MEFTSLPGVGGNILKSFVTEENDIEKAKKFDIGRLDKSGKHVKTANGWMPVKMHGHLATHHHSGEPIVTPNQMKIPFKDDGKESGNITPEKMKRAAEEIASQMPNRFSYEGIPSDELIQQAVEKMPNSKHLTESEKSKIASMVKKIHVDAEAEWVKNNPKESATDNSTPVPDTKQVDSKVIDADTKKTVVNKSPESHNSVRDWSGEHLKDEHINSIIESLDEAGITDADLKIKKTPNWSQEAESDAIHNKVKELRSQHRPGLEHKDMSKQDIYDVLWGMVRSAQDGHKFFNTGK